MESNTPSPPPASTGTFPGRAAGLLAGALLVGLGVLLLAFNLVPLLGLRPLDWNRVWPIFFWLAAGVCYAPAILIRAGREYWAALYIPATMLMMLGLIFLYQAFSDDWGSWAYAWLLLPGSIGLGVAFAGAVGRWGGATVFAGLVVAGIFTALFALFASIFGGPLLKAVGPGLFILIGLLLLLRSLFRQ